MMLGDWFRVAERIEMEVSKVAVIRAIVRMRIRLADRKAYDFSSSWGQWSVEADFH